MGAREADLACVAAAQAAVAVKAHEEELARVVAAESAEFAKTGQVRKRQKAEAAAERVRQD